MKPAQDASGHLVDLTNCDREPIHIPGRVQSHGVLFALREPDLAIEQVSVNTAALLGVQPEQVLGQRIDSLADGADAGRCRRWLASPGVRDASPMRLSMRGRLFDASACRHQGVLLMEIENGRGDRSPAAAQADSPEGTATPQRDAADTGPSSAGHGSLDDPGGLPWDRSGRYRLVRTAMDRLQAAKTLAQFCEVAASEMRALTGFDRVTVYRFDADWNGQVFGEARREDLGPLLGLHFPASDIPAQARRLYCENKIRLIVDADSEPVALAPPLHPRTQAPLDLTYSYLRSVSPVHIQYLKNMGARTSMSVSLMRDGKLWGLLSCLHYSGSLYVPPAVRDACEFLGQLVSVQLAVKEDAEGHEYRRALSAVRERLLQRMSAEGDLVRGLAGEDLLALTGATGAAIVHDEACALHGATPDAEQVQGLVAWLRVHANGELFHTDSLARLHAPAEQYRNVASGLLAISTTRDQGHYVLWFRPEVIQTVDWGGDPRKPVGREAAPGLLTPRRSFELWQEVVRLKSLPWQSWEVDAASMLRDAILAVVVRHAEKLTRLNAELERSNADLDAFAFITSHDLKEPLRGINNYAHFLLEDYAERLDADGRDKLQTLVRLSHRLEDIVESLLQYSRLGRVDLAVEATDLNPILADVLDVLKLTLAKEQVEVRVHRPLPIVQCDKTQAELLLTNLITNAIKYNDKPEKWIEIGYEEPRGATARAFAAEHDAREAPEPDRAVLYVRDNGIGVPAKHQHAVFRMFKRLHGRDKFGGGTGAGLAFAKKVVERHGGTLWVESAVGKGSTFYFTFAGAAPRAVQ